MRLTTFILKNLWNRPVRTVLTVFGLSIGIAAVVALMGIAWGFERSFLSLYQSKGIDLVVVRAGISNRLSSNLDSSLAAKIRGIQGVKDVASSLVDTVSFEDAHLVAVIINGWESGGLLLRGLPLVAGRGLRPDDDRAAMLGRVLALSLGKKPGDSLEIAGETFRIVGIFNSTSSFESGSLIVPIGTLQKLMGRQGQVTAFVIAADHPEDGDSVREVGEAIEREIAGVAATTARDYVDRDYQISLAKSMAWATSLVALIIGSVGVLNTMVMAVHERTSEIGTLRAIGWKRRRVLALILGESLALGFLATIIGIALAYGFLQILLLSPSSRNFIDPNLPHEVLLVGLAMGIGLSFLGGTYPALRGAALKPTEALRHG